MEHAGGWHVDTENDYDSTCWLHSLKAYSGNSCKVLAPAETGDIDVCNMMCVGCSSNEIV